MRGFVRVWLPIENNYGVFAGAAVVLGTGVCLGSEGPAAGVGLDTGEDLGVAAGLEAAGLGATDVGATGVGATDVGGVVAVGEGLGFGIAARTSGLIFTLDNAINCH